MKPKRENYLIKIEGFDTGEIHLFQSFQELVEFMQEIDEDFRFEQNLILVKERPAFITR